MAFVPARTARANATSIHALNSIQEGTAASLRSASRVRAGVTASHVVKPVPQARFRAGPGFRGVPSAKPACLPARKARDRSPRPRRDRRSALVSQVVKEGTIGGPASVRSPPAWPRWSRARPDRRDWAGDGKRSGHRGLRRCRVLVWSNSQVTERSGRPAVIGGVEVGCQIFGVPAQPGSHPLFRTLPARLRERVQQLGSGDPEPVQQRCRAAAGRSCHRMTWYCVHPGAGRTKNLASACVSASEPAGLKRAVIRSGARARRRSRRTAISPCGSASVMRCR